MLMERGEKLPLPGQAATTLENRLEKGVEAQTEIFGSGMEEAWKNGHINRWLAANCFGDYYTRTGQPKPSSPQAASYKRSRLITRPIFCAR